MGIRLQCENCKKSLHLKSDLAGRKGICPDCKHRFRIPAETVVTNPEPMAPATGVDMATVSKVVPEASAYVSGKQTSVQRTAKTPDTNQLYWVSPPSGGRYGPADVSMLLQWAQQNRITKDSLLFEATIESKESESNPITANEVATPGIRAEVVLADYFNPAALTSPTTHRGEIDREMSVPVTHRGAKSPLVAVKLKRNRASDLKLIIVCILIAIVVLLAVALYRILFFR